MKENNTSDINGAITLLVEGTACNLDCAYCYRKGQGVKEKNIAPKFNYSVEHMLKALTKKRLGGAKVICFCGGGETLLPKEVPLLVKGLLKEGHVVDLITNLTLSNRIDEILEAPRHDLERLVLKASLHYIELKRTNKLDTYFSNFNKLIAAGASASPILTTCEEYLPLLDEIKDVCLKEINTTPHITSAIEDFNTTMHTREFYDSNFVNTIQTKFDSKIFDTFNRLLTIKPSDHFCYAGKWNFILDATTGDIRSCFYKDPEQSIFKNIKEPIKLTVVGHSCKKPHCALNYNWIGMGLIPDLEDFPTYGKMMYKENSYNPKLCELLDFKFNKMHKLFNEEEKKVIDEANLYVPKKYKMSYLNKIRFKIYVSLRKKLEKKGII